MKTSHFKLKNLILFAMISIACVCLARQTPAQTSSSDGSASVTVKQSVINDCAKALDELAVLDKLTASQEAEIKLLKERVELEKEKAALMREIADARSRQAESLTEANKALRDALAAKEKVIENKDKEIEILRKKKPSVLKIIRTVAVGVAIGALLR